MASSKFIKSLVTHEAPSNSTYVFEIKYSKFSTVGPFIHIFWWIELNLNIFRESQTIQNTWQSEIKKRWCVSSSTVNAFFFPVLLFWKTHCLSSAKLFQTLQRCVGYSGAGLHTERPRPIQFRPPGRSCALRNCKIQLSGSILCGINNRLFDSLIYSALEIGKHTCVCIRNQMINSLCTQTKCKNTNLYCQFRICSIGKARQVYL